MSKGVLSTTAEIVNGIWGIGAEVYRTVSDEIADVIDEEARSRTLEYFDGDEIDEQSPAFRRRYRIEREAVARQYKSVALKGGLIALGLGIFA